MTSFKRWLGAGAIVLVALALVACPSLVPKSTGTIPNMTFEHAEIGESKTVSNVGRFFQDDDGAKYKGASNKDAVATASVVDGTTLKVTAKGVGEATVTVTATASNGRDTAEQMFKVTVKKAPVQPNRAPTLKTIHDIESLVEGTSRTVDLMPYAEDADGDTLTFTVMSSDVTKVTASPPGTGSTTTIMGVASGMATITVTVSDGNGGSDSGTFEVTVTETNSSPVPTDIPDVSLKVAETDDIDLSDFYWDPEDDELDYTARSSNEMVATVSDPGDGSMITITAIGVGRARITVSATDGINEAVPQRFTVMVGSRSPVAVMGISTDVDLSMEDEASMTTTIDLSRYFEDPDNDPLMYAVSDAGNPMVATPGLEEGSSTLTITAVAAGNTMITVTADDEDMDNESASQTFSVTVHARMPDPNNPPMRTEMAAPTVALVLEDDPSEMVDVMGHFSDADGDELTYEAAKAEGDTAIGDPSVSGSMVTITAVAAGEATVTVTASDGNGGSAMMDIMVTVTEPGNMAPQRKSGKMLRDLRIQIVGTAGTDEETGDDAADNKKIDLSEYFEDPDGVLLFYKVGKTADNPDDADEKPVINLHSTAATADAGAMGKPPNGTNDDDTEVIIEPLNPGTATVKVTVIDIGKKEFVDTFMVTVVAAGTNTGPEDADTTTDIADQTRDASATENKRLKIDEARKVFDGKFSEHFKDDNFNSGDMLTISVEYYPATTDADTAKAGTGKLDADDAKKVGVTHSLSATTWSGDPNAKFTLTLTGRMGTPDDGIVVALIATDTYDERHARVFTVRVNNRPKAEGAQASATPAGKPLTLGGLDMHMDMGFDADKESEDNMDVVLVADDSGYFHDPDGDDLVCRINDSSGDAAEFTIDQDSHTVTINPVKKGNASVTVACVDTFNEHSPEATLDVKVTHQSASIH